MDIFTLILHQPIYNLMIVFYRVLGDNLGWAIIAIALLSRLITIPITRKQIANAQKAREMNEKVSQIKAKYKNDKEKQSKEMLKVQSEYLPGQLSGCLSLIVQTILLVTVYHVINSLLSPNFAAEFDKFAYSFVKPLIENGAINGDFLFGLLQLGQAPSTIGGDSVLRILPYILLTALVGVSQFASNKVLMGLNAAKQKEGTENKKQPSKQKKPAQEEMPDFAEMMQQSTKQTMIIFPILLMFMSWNFPSGLSLYWTVQSGFVIIQQLVFAKLSKK